MEDYSWDKLYAFYKAARIRSELDRIQWQKDLMRIAAVAGGNLFKGSAKVYRSDIERLTQAEENLLASDSPQGLVASLVGRLQRGGVPKSNG